MKRSYVSVYHQKFGEKDEEINCKTITKKRHLEIWILILNVPVAISNGIGDVIAPFLRRLTFCNLKKDLEHKSRLGLQKSLLKVKTEIIL